MGGYVAADDVFGCSRGQIDYVDERWSIIIIIIERDFQVIAANAFSIAVLFLFRFVPPI